MSMTSTPKSMMDSEFGYEIEYIDNDEEEKNVVDYGYIYNEYDDYYYIYDEEYGEYEEDEEDEEYEDDSNDP